MTFRPTALRLALPSGLDRRPGGTGSGSGRSGY